MTRESSEIKSEPTIESPRNVRILMTEFVTHDVKRFIVEKPENYEFRPGQASLVMIPEKGWENKDGLFTFTSSSMDNVIEFTIKAYRDHNGITKHMHEMNVGDMITLHEPFGTIEYRGKGVFLAAGAGITPFIAIFRDLHGTNQLKGNTLIFSNKRGEDVILEKELRSLFSDNLILTLTRENIAGYEHGRINKQMLEKHITDWNQYFYLCGPDPFVVELRETLLSLGVDKDKVIAESFILADAGVQT